MTGAVLWRITWRSVTGAITGVSTSLTVLAVGTITLGATTLFVIVLVSTMFGAVDELNLLYSTTPGSTIFVTPLVVRLTSYCVMVSAKTGTDDASAIAGSVIAINFDLNILGILLPATAIRL